jgi:hypothetical protein
VKTLSHLLAAALLSAAGASAHSPNGPFSVSISAGQTTVPIGRPIVIAIRLQNTSSESITIDASNGLEQGELYYKVHVLNERGQVPRPTDYLRGLEGSGKSPHPTVRARSSIIFTLQPGESLNDSVNITKLFDISQPGRYEVRVSRTVPVWLGSGMVNSNAITITVR